MTLADIALYAYTHVAHEGGFDLAALPGDPRVARAGRGAARARSDRRLSVVPAVAGPAQRELTLLAQSRFTPVAGSGLRSSHGIDNLENRQREDRKAAEGGASCDTVGRGERGRAADAFRSGRVRGGLRRSSNCWRSGDGERLVRFAYSTDGVGRRGPVTLRARDVERLHKELGRTPALAALLGSTLGDASVDPAAAGQAQPLGRDA